MSVTVNKKVRRALFTEHEKIIAEKLSEIEEKENVRVIYAAESGSRAWGFASPDSDFDVRFIYVRQPEFYLRLDKTRDVIEWQLDDVYDVNGWDIKKTLTLLHKSNPTVFEWNSSPIVYKTTGEWKYLSEKIDACFISKAGIYHYLSTARGNYREFLRGEKVKAKKYFYVIRPLLACRWIIERRTPPPMLFDELVRTQLPRDIAPEISRLLEMKRTLPEMGVIDRIDKLNTYIEKSFDEVESSASEISSKNDGCTWDTLNKIFLDILG